MILTLFIALLALSVVVALLGYFTGDEPYLTVGLFFLFLLSVVIITGNLEYETGNTVVTAYVYDNASVSGSSTTITYVFTAWNDATSQKVGWGLGVISFIGVALSLYHQRNERLK